MVNKKIMTAKEMKRKIIDLKIELLKNVTKRKSIKKEIARLLTMARSSASRGVGVRGVGVSDAETTGNKKGKKSNTKSDGGSK